MSPGAGREGSLGRGARARILEAAGTLFARQGFNATSINELHATARVSKRTLYQHFDSKDDLIVAYLAERQSVGPAEAVLAREDLAPRARLLELFSALADPPGVAPDPFLAAVIEFPDPEHPVHLAAAEHDRRFSERLSGLARAAGARNPDRTARRLALLYAGGAARVMLEDPGEVVAEAYPVAAAILRDAID